MPSCGRSTRNVKPEVEAKGRISTACESQTSHHRCFEQLAFWCDGGKTMALCLMSHRASVTVRPSDEPRHLTLRNNAEIRYGRAVTPTKRRAATLVRYASGSNKACQRASGTIRGSRGHCCGQEAPWSEREDLPGAQDFKVKDVSEALQLQESIVRILTLLVPSISTLESKGPIQAICRWRAALWDCSVDADHTCTLGRCRTCSE